MTKHLLFICLLALTIFSNNAKAQCVSPTNLAVTYNNNVSTFTWDSVPGAVGYYFDIKFQWDASWGSGSGIYTSAHSYSMTGLFQTAPFTWRVATDCGSSLSSYTESSYATPCPEPTNLSAISVATTSATVGWIPAAGYNTTTSNFSVGYRLANTSNAWISAGTTSTASKTISGLLSNTVYEFCVNQSCMYGNSNPVIGTFTTAYVACDVPATITTSSASSNQATINWSAVNGGLNYTVEYKPTTNSTWSSVVVANNTITLTNLINATLYDVRVKANCTLGISNYVSTQFTTYSATCMAYGINGSEYIDLFSLGSINRTSGREIGGYFNTNLITNLAKGSTTTGQFSAGYNPGIILGENFAVYIDFNNNGSFADAGERVVAPTYVTSGSANYNFSMTIPTNASQGIRKMRVIIRRSNTSIVPCATGFYGEVEDYKVNIVNNGNRMAATSNSNTDGIDAEITATNFMVYPNPSTGNYTIEMPENTSASWYAIYSINGLLVEKQNVNNNQFTIDLSNQNNGIYLLNVYSNEANKISTQKLQLNK